MLIYVIIFFIITYILLFINKLDNIDKSLYYFIKNSNNFNLETPIKTYLKCVYKALLIPFNNKIYLKNLLKVVFIVVIYMNIILN